MTTSLQPGITALGTRSHYYLEFDLIDPAEAHTLVGIAGAGLADARTTVGGVNVVVGFRRDVWEQATTAPVDLADFEELTGPDGFAMPATQHDAWVWIAGTGADVVFDAARSVVATLGSVATVATQHAGFAYRDSRDLSGFEDGTENPPLSEVTETISIPAGEPGAGGSVVFVQRWVHDLGALERLDPAAQEDIIGRTKATSEELDDDVRPETSHISRVVIEEDGEELEIFRRSVPYGHVTEHGLMFVAFSIDQRRLDLMLRRMVGLDGPRDAITTWSTPVSGAYYFVPPSEAMGA